jgi:hypothetical protein
MTPHWPMLEYIPVRGAWERVQYRSICGRKLPMRRVFKERGLVEFVARLEDLRKNPRLNGAEKRLVFEGILNDYAAFITAQQTPVGTAEAAPVEDAGSAAVVLPDHGGSVQQSDGARLDAVESIPELASEDIGEPIIEGDL